MSYTTVQNVADYLEITIDGTTTPNTTTVEKWIEWADDEIDNEVNGNFNQNTSTDIIIPSEYGQTQWVGPDYRPIISVTSLETNTGSDFDITWDAKTQGTDFIIADKDTGVLHFNNITLNERVNGIKLTIVHGYSSVPKLVEEISTLLTVKNFVSHSLSNTSQGSTESIKVGPIALRNDSGNSITYMKDLNSQINDLMKKLGTFNSYIY